MTVLSSGGVTKFRNLTPAEVEAVAGGRQGLISELWGGPAIVDPFPPSTPDPISVRPPMHLLPDWNRNIV